MDRSLGFGSTPQNYAPCSDSVSLRLRFRLTLLCRVTRWPIMQKVRRHLSRRLRQLVCIRFQVLFHFPSGILFTFPSRYLCTIGRQVVFSLGWWSTRIPTGFLVSRGTQVPRSASTSFAYRAFTFYGRTFQTVRLPVSVTCSRPYNPEVHVLRFGLLPFRSPLLRESHLISFPEGTEMVQFSSFASCTYEFSTGYLV